MARVTHTLNLPRDQVRRLATDANGDVRKAFDRLGGRVTRQAKRNLSAGPTRAVDTGALRASIAYEVTVRGDTITVRIGSGEKHALFVHEGTGIYGPKGTPIRPKRAKVLRFLSSRSASSGFIGPGGQGFVFVKEVKGMRPRPYLTKALERAKAFLN